MTEFESGGSGNLSAYSNYLIFDEQTQRWRALQQSDPFPGSGDTVYGLSGSTGSISLATVAPDPTGNPSFGAFGAEISGSAMLTANSAEGGVSASGGATITINGTVDGGASADGGGSVSADTVNGGAFASAGGSVTATTINGGASADGGTVSAGTIVDGDTGDDQITSVHVSSGGTLTASSLHATGPDGGADGVSGGTLTIGAYGNGTTSSALTIADGGTAQLTSIAADHMSLSISGAGSTLSYGGTLLLGDSATGNLTVMQGASQTLDAVTLGNQSTGAGALQVTAATLEITGGLTISVGAKNSSIAVGGAGGLLTVDGSLKTATQSGSSGQITIGGGGALKAKGGATFGAGKTYVLMTDAGSLFDLGSSALAIGNNDFVQFGLWGGATLSTTGAVTIGGAQSTSNGTLTVRGANLNGSQGSASHANIGALSLQGKAGFGNATAFSGGIIAVTGDVNIDTQAGTSGNFVDVSDSGSKLTAANLTVGSEQATIDQYGVWTNTGTSGSFSAISGGYIGVLHTVTLDNPSGTFVNIAGGSGIEVGGAHGIGGAGGVAANGLLVDAGGRIVGHGTTTAATIVDNGVIEARHGTLTLRPTVANASNFITGTGNFQIDDQATLEIGGGFAAGGTVTFNGGYQTTLKIDNPNQFHGTIAGLAAGDTIYLPGDALASEEGANLAHTQISGSQLILTFSNNHTLTYNLSGAPSGDVFTIRDMATTQAGNTDIALTLEPGSAEVSSGSAGGAAVPGHPTGNTLIDSLIWGWGSWAPGATISYWFGETGDIDSAVQVHGDTGELPYQPGAAVDNWNQAEEDDFEAAVQEYAAVSGLHFAQASSAQSANIVWWLEPSLAGGGALGISEVPAEVSDGHVWQYFADTPWTNDPNQLSFGGDGFNTIVHELGHTLGLAHPHDGGAEPDANTFPEVTGPFGSYGLNAQNQSVFTIMSYNPGWLGQPATTLDYGTQEGPGALDIAALQQLYGANPSNNPTDTYTLPTANAPGTGWFCIYDTGGANVITNAGSNLACAIDLRAAPLTGVNAGGYVSHDATIQGGFTIAHGVLIQNAIGGGGDDLLIGGTGAETFTGGGGDDRIIGGSGVNTAIYSGPESAYSWVTTGDVTDITDNRPGSPDGVDILQNIQDLRFSDETAQLEPTILGPTIVIDPVGDTDILNALEAKDPLAIVGITTGAVGQTVTVTFHNVQYTGAVQGDGTWSVSVPTAALAPSTLPDGDYTIKADVTDASGDAAPEASEVLHVRETPAGVASVTVSPANAASAGQLVRLTLHLSAPVTVYQASPPDDDNGASGSSAKTPTLSLNDGGVAIYDAASSTPTAMVFDYTVGASDNTANLAVTAFNSNEAAALDIYGNPLDASHALVSTGLAIGVASALAVRADFDGDGLSNVLLRNGSGALTDWTMNGSAVTASTLLTTGGAAVSLPAAWTVNGIADLNADKKADVLLRNSNGSFADWTMNGAKIVTSQLLTSQGAVVALPSTWNVSGLGDFNGDRDADVLLRNSNGTFADWTMNGSQIASSQLLTSQGATVALPAAWSVNGIGDFNGDHDADVLLRNANGTFADWTMNGSHIASSQLLTSQGATVTLPTAWSVAGVGDFNGDGHADVLLRNASGTLADWAMNGAQIASSQLLTRNGATATLDSSWSIAALGDFTGDGKSDILLQNTSGAFQEWAMNGSTVTAATAVTAAGNPVTTPAWHAQGSPTDLPFG